MNPKAMTLAGIILIICGIALVSCAHQGNQLKDACSLSKQITQTKTEFYTPPETVEPAILHVLDRDPATGRILKMRVNPYTGEPIVAKWNAYRDKANHTVYGVEYDLTDNQP